MQEDNKNKQSETSESGIRIDTSQDAKRALNITGLGTNSSISSPFLNKQNIELVNLGVQRTFLSGPNQLHLNDRLSFVGDSSYNNQFKLIEEITELKRKLKKAADDYSLAEAGKDAILADFNKLNEELVSKEKLNHILSRISEEGRKHLLDSADFQSLFDNFRKCESVVLSIDIRRSTELMLKAKSPELFSKFITELSFKLSQVIISNFGIFDKFTGDGILSFFPKFYSGKDAIIRSLKAAYECHEIFTEHYNQSRNCFNIFMLDVGLGIGIDYGLVTLVNTQSELTVVGVPVVYACRFSSAKVGETLLNQPALEEIMSICPQFVKSNSSEIFIKNEGLALGYNVLLNEHAFNMSNPNWTDLYKQYK